MAPPVSSKRRQTINHLLMSVSKSFLKIITPSGKNHQTVPNTTSNLPKILFIGFFLCIAHICCSSNNKQIPNNKQTTVDVVALSQDLLLAARTNEWQTADSLWQQLALLNQPLLSQQLNTDAYKKAFWLNLYNATVQYQLKQHANLYNNRSRFYATPFVQIAQQQLSLDDIEHGILRRSKIKLSLGYLNKWFIGHFEQQMRVAKLDPRIHFALNCGAKSCPAIAYYSPEKIDEQLETATKVYLSNECELVANDALQIPILFSWFRADFGGTKGIYQFLQHYQIISNNDKPKLIYKNYNWNLELDNYR